jgi:hypothetical protein
MYRDLHLPTEAVNIVPRGMNMVVERSVGQRLGSKELS